MTNSFTTTIPSGSTISVYQAWDLDRDTRWKLSQLTREQNATRLRSLFVASMAKQGYVGSFHLTEDASLEDLYRLLQNDTHPEGWVEALDAQRRWVEKVPACSLSVGDVLVTDDSWFIVAPIGFFQIR